MPVDKIIHKKDANFCIMYCKDAKSNQWVYQEIKADGIDDARRIAMRYAGPSSRPANVCKGEYPYPMLGRVIRQDERAFFWVKEPGNGTAQAIDRQTGKLYYDPNFKYRMYFCTITKPDNYAESLNSVIAYNLDQARFLAMGGFTNKVGYEVHMYSSMDLMNGKGYFGKISYTPNGPMWTSSRGKTNRINMWGKLVA